MNPFGTRGAALFADALDGGALAAPLPGLALAQRLRAAGASFEAACAPRAEFRDALRTRLLAVATVQAAVPAPVAVPLSSAVSWRRRSGAVAAGTMASVVAVSGVAVAGSQSLPGDPFYGVKKAAEAFQLRTADGDVQKGTQHLEFAATRLREVRGLTLGRDALQTGGAAAREDLDAEQVARVRATLGEMDAQTREGTALLNEAFRASRAPEPLRVLGTFARRQSVGLAGLLPVLPPRTQDRARISLALLSGVAAEADELLGTTGCTQGCDPSQAAPQLSTAPGPVPTVSTAPCDCTTTPSPQPAPGPTAPAEPDGQPSDGEPTPEPSSTPTSEPTPQPSSPTPSPSPSPSSSGMPLPLPPLPVPLPTLPPLPVPLPTLTLAPAAAPVQGRTSTGTSSGSTGSSSSKPGPSAPGSPAEPAPLPAVAPAPPRP